MKSILKLAACMAAGLLIVSCSHHSHSSSIPTLNPSASIPVVRGVLEKGKVTAATCEVITLSDGKALYKATVKDGTYVVDVPAVPFKIDCKVTAYINDKTGKSETKPIELKTLSSANADDKEKTLNINVLTTLVADQVAKGNLKGMTAQSLEEAKTKAKEDVDTKYGIVIGDIDTLSLKDQGVLAEVSLAVQAELDTMSFDDSIAHLDKNQIQAEKGKAVNPNAVASLNKDLKPPALIVPKPVTPTNGKGKPTVGKLAALSTGGTTLIDNEDVAQSPADIDASNAVAFALPAELVTDLADGESIYLSGKAGAMPVQLQEQVPSFPYSADDVSDLFDGIKPTTFTVCIVSDMIIESSACSGATTKQTFTATASTAATAKP